MNPELTLPIVASVAHRHPFPFALMTVHRKPGPAAQAAGAEPQSQHDRAHGEDGQAAAPARAQHGPQLHLPHRGHRAPDRPAGAQPLGQQHRAHPQLAAQETAGASDTEDL